MQRAQNVLARQQGLRRLLLAILLGFISALSLPPIDAWPVLFVTIPAFYALAERGHASWRGSFLTGWCFGFGYFLWTLHWIGFAFLVDANDYLWMMPFAVLGLVAFLALYWGLALVALHVSGKRGLPGFLIFVTALAVAEYFRGILLTGFPWGAPGLAVDGMGAVAQLAAWCGMEGLSLLIPLWAGVWVFLFLAMSKRHRVSAALILAGLPIAYGFGALRLAFSETDSGTGVVVRLVQPNIPQNDKWRGDNMAAIFERLMSLSARASPSGQKPGIIIWPESAVPYMLEEASESRSLIGGMLGPGRLLITGSLRMIADPSGDYMKDRVFNSVLVVGGSGEVINRYDKWKLVPGGEFLPFESILAPLGFRRIVTLPGSFEAGPGPIATALPGFPVVGLSVCYEAIFPAALVNPDERPAWLVNVTNDGWFGASIGPYAHFAQARLRAIEQGLPLVRVANTGISGVVDAYGRTTIRSNLEEEWVADSVLPGAIAPTPYARFCMTIATLLAVLFGALACVLDRYRH